MNSEDMFSHDSTYFVSQLLSLQNSGLSQSNYGWNFQNEKINMYINQKTNGPVNAHLISWPSKAQNIQNLENI